MQKSPLLLLSTGTILNVIAQFVTDTGFADPKSQIIPWIKFTASLIFAAISQHILRRHGNQPSHKPTPRQKRLMMLVGLLDCTAYTSFTLGFTYCGTALSNIILSSTGQIFTALATRFILGKRLNNGQMAAISCVFLGLLIRTLPASYFDPTAAAAANTGSLLGSSASDKESTDLVMGAALVTLAAFLYSGLGVAYEALITTTGKPPPYPDVLWNISLLGFTVSSAYQLLYTLPRWDSLVGQRALVNGFSRQYVISLLTAFAAMFNLHMFAQSFVFKTEGALGVGLVNAVRGAVMTFLSGVLFCSEDRPWLCMTRQSVVTAVVTTLGGVAWVLTKPVPVEKTKKEVEEDKEEKKEL